MHDGSADDGAAGLFGYEADYGNTKVWNLDFLAKLRDLVGLIWNRGTFRAHLSVRPSDSQICTDLYWLLFGFMEEKFLPPQFHI